MWGVCVCWGGLLLQRPVWERHSFIVHQAGRQTNSLPVLLELSWAAAGDEVEPACSQGWHIPSTGGGGGGGVRDTHKDTCAQTSTVCWWTRNKQDKRKLRGNRVFRLKGNWVFRKGRFEVIPTKAVTSCEGGCETVNHTWCCFSILKWQT